jgi:hypothetical protein
LKAKTENLKTHSNYLLAFRFKNFKVYRDSKDFPIFAGKKLIGIAIRSIYEVVAGFALACHFKMIDERLNSEIEEKAGGLLKQLSGFRASLKTKS